MAGVWGRPVQQEAEVDQDILDSEFACSICYVKPQSVRFRPCKHAACKACVDSLRRTNIFKADAGVKCPYCRGYVEGYEPLEKGSALDDDLSAANKAAKAAAAARHGPKMPSIQNVSAPQGVSSSATQERWHCSCGKTNTGFRERCSSCNRPNPIAPASKETERKDLLKCSDDEILALSIQKLHPFLDSAFKEAGMPIEQSSALSGNNLSVGGTEASVQQAITKNGLEKLKRIVKSLTSHGHVHSLLFHWYGNYTLQDLVEAGSKLRRAAVVMLHQGQEGAFSAKQIATLQALIDGKDDLLGLIVKEVAKDAVEAALHKQGTYALQKMLESPCTDSEFVMLGKSLMQKAVELVNGEPGIYVMGKLVEQLVKAANRADNQSTADEAHKLCNSICELYLSKKAKYDDSQRYEKLRYDMIVAAICGGIQQESSANLAIELAKQAFDIQKKTPGRFLVKQLMKMQPRRKAAQDFVQNVVCHVGEAFETNLVELMLKNDERPPHVVTVLMQELNVNNEVDWVEHLVGEMVEGVPEYAHSSEAMNIMKESLGLSCLSEEFVKEQLMALKAGLPRGSKTQYDEPIWAERKKNLAAKQPAVTDGVNGKADSVQSSEESPRQDASTSQEAAGPSMPSVQQIEAGMLQQNAPASSVPSLQQVQAEQAAEELLKGQHQQPSQAPTTSGSVNATPGAAAARSEASAAAEGPSSSQVSSQNSPAGDASIRKVQYAGPLPSYIPEDELQRLLNQSSAHAASAAGKAPPPGFAGNPAFPSSTSNGVPGLPDALAAPSPNRGRQRSGHPAYNPVLGSPAVTPARPSYSPSQSPERPSASSSTADVLSFLFDAPAQPSSQQPAAAAPSVTAAATGRKAPLYQPPYQPPSAEASGVDAWLSQSQGGSSSSYSPQMSPREQGRPKHAPRYAPPSLQVQRPYVPPYAPHLSAAKPVEEEVKDEVLVADVIPPLPAPNPPIPNHRREQPLYKPPMDRHNQAPSPRGAAVNHASHQPLPRSDSNDAWASEAPIAAGRAYAQVPFVQVPFVQQQQNKQQLPVQHKAAIKTAASQQRAQAGQGRGPISAPRAEPASQQSSSPHVYEADTDGPTPWTCPICTYHHQDKEAGFLSCAICAHTRGTPV